MLLALEYFYSQKNILIILLKKLVFGLKVYFDLSYPGFSLT